MQERVTQAKLKIMPKMLPNLQHLDLRVAYADYGFLSKLTSLNSLALCGLHMKARVSVLRCLSLRSLDISRNKIFSLNDELLHHTGLTKLDISENIVNNRTFSISPQSKLRSLTASQCGMFSLKGVLTQTRLERLNLCSNPYINIGSIGRLYNLTWLNLALCNVDDEKVKFLPMLPHLRTLILWGNPITKFPKLSITNLDIMACKNLINETLNNLPMLKSLQANIWHIDVDQHWLSRLETLCLVYNNRSVDEQKQVEAMRRGLLKTTIVDSVLWQR
ncbi:MAG: hypothetical protein ACPGXY_03700 [Alphaproteobacteria bacterium]